LATIRIDHAKCNLCMECIRECPFDALSLADGEIQINAGCKLCGLCLKQCPAQAMIREENGRKKADRDGWKDILVFVEANGGAIHPVTFELIGKALKLAAKLSQRVHCVYIGEGAAKSAEALKGYGLNRIFVYDDPAYRYFSAQPYADAFYDCIAKLRPSIVLVGATAVGRSLAPRLSTRFKTGLTADCTVLDVRENTDLVQIRPAFGGNIMARIITPYTRPQFATVRYKVMDAAKPLPGSGGIVELHRAEISPSRLTVLDCIKKQAQANISDADVLVAGGRGLKSEKDLSMLGRLAELLGGQVAGTRPLVEAGFLPYTRQIGLSGRTVKPKLIITCGISGAVQFTACMKTAECIIAINKDKNAPIFKIAHYGIVGDLYEIIPALIRKLSEKVNK